MEVFVTEMCQNKCLWLLLYAAQGLAVQNGLLSQQTGHNEHATLREE